MEWGWSQKDRGLGRNTLCRQSMGHAKRQEWPWNMVWLVFIGWVISYANEWEDSVQFSPSVMSDSLRPHEPQHARPPCPSPTSRAYSNSCPSRWWCHPASTLATVLPMNIQGWFPLGFTDLISLLSKGLSRVFFSTSLKESVLWRSAFFMVQLSHPYTTTGKTIASTIWTLVGQVMPLLFNTLSRYVTAFFQGTGIF